MGTQKNKKVLTINLSRLLRDEWFQLITDFWEAVREFGTETLHIPNPIWEKYAFWRTEADRVVRPIEKSTITPVLVELDDARTKLFTGLKKFVESFLTYVDATKKQAAINVSNICNAYKDVPKDNYKRKSSAIYNFIQELKNNYVADVATLDINTRLLELDKANKEFENKWDEREAKIVIAETPYTFEEVQQELDWYYTLCTWQFELTMAAAPDVDTEKIILLWNDVIKKYRKLIAVRENENDNENWEEEV